MKKLLLLFCVFVLVAGCAKYKLAISSLNAISDECQNSIIYRTIPAPDISSGIIQISLNQFIKAGPEWRSWAISINQKAIELADDPAMTPAKFAAEITAEVMLINKWWGAELVRLVEPVFDAFKTTNGLMDQCVREFIKRFCKQRLEHWKNVAFLSQPDMTVEDFQYLSVACQSLSDLQSGLDVSGIHASTKICALIANGPSQWVCD